MCLLLDSTTVLLGTSQALVTDVSMLYRRFSSSLHSALLSRTKLPQSMTQENAPVTCTTRSSIGTAVANFLKHPAETANKIVRTYTAVITQNETLAAFEEATGFKWKVIKADLKDVVSGAREALQKQQFRDAFAGILTAQLFEDGTKRSLIATPEDTDNRLLGVQSEDLNTYIKELVSTAT